MPRTASSTTTTEPESTASLSATGDATTQSLGLALGRFQRCFRGMLDAALEPHGLHASEYGALALIDVEPGITSAALAHRLSVSPQATAQLLATLAERGLIRRTTHPTVARGLATRLTAAGRRRLAGAREAYAETTTALLSPLTATQAAHLVEHLTRCADAHLTGDSR